MVSKYREQRKITKKGVPHSLFLGGVCFEDLLERPQLICWEAVLVSLLAGVHTTPRVLNIARAQPVIGK